MAAITYNGLKVKDPCRESISKQAAGGQKTPNQYYHKTGFEGAHWSPPENSSRRVKCGSVE